MDKSLNINAAQNNIKNMMEVSERVVYWENILVDYIDFTDKEWDKFLISGYSKSILGGNEPYKYSAADIDEYIKAKYAKELLKPEIMAKLLGDK